MSNFSIGSIMRHLRDQAQEMSSLKSYHYLLVGQFILLFEAESIM